MADPRWHVGMFPWRELMTVDVEGARRFYGELFGWSFRSSEPEPGELYWHASRDGKDVAGMMRRPARLQIPPAWFSYVLVDDVDAAAARCREGDGRVLFGPMDIPGVGRFAVAGDRWGATLHLFRATSRESAPPAPAPATFCWETLVTPDPPGAIAFWGKVVGFGTGRTPNGEGVVLTAGEAQVADVQPARGKGPAYWATYVAVESAERSRDLAARLGGRILVPRIDVPKVGVIAFVADPAGASFGLFEAAR